VLKAAAAGGAERTTYWDAALPGFGLMVTRNGARSYVVDYRDARRQKRRMSIKATLPLDQARKEAKAILGQVAKGGDPLAERRKVEATASDTLQSITEEYLSREGKRLRSIDQRRAVFERLVYPKFGARQIADITRREIARLLDKIEDERGPVMADMVLACLRRLMSWHAGRSDDFRSPIVRGMARTKPQERARTRILSDDELRAVWRAAEASQNPFARMVLYILLTATRRDEAARMTRREIDGADWTIPAARHKGKHDMLIPLSEAAQALLMDVPVIGRRSGGFVFTTDGERPLGGFSKFKRAFDQACGVTGWTLHDLRRTARSLMSRAGVPSDHAERCLGHVIGGVRGTYDRHEYHDEKARAFEALAALIDRIVNPPAANVVSIGEVRAYGVP
jgi:integrase